MLGCICQALAFVAFLGASICSVFTMTAHKYFSIVSRWQLNDLHVSGMITASWMVPFFIALAFVLADSSGTLLGLQSSKNYCLVAMERNDVSNIVAALVIFVFIFGTILWIVFAHAHIVIKYREWQKIIIVSGSLQSVDHVVDEETLRKEAILIRKSAAISGIFSCSWIFYCIQIIYEISTHRKVPREYDDFWISLAMIIPILNLVVLYVYDAKFKRNINYLIPTWFGTFGRTLFSYKITHLAALIEPGIPTPVHVGVMLPRERDDKSTVQLGSFKLGKING